MKFPAIHENLRIRRLTPPKGRLRMVLDTDTYNEIDDQFAVVHAMLAPEKLQMEAIYAAPFLNQRSTSPGDGMEKSHEEILRLLSRLKREPKDFVFRGSDRFLENPEEPVNSEAVQDLIERAEAIDPEVDEPLYVAAIAAITNVASAILIRPDIIRKIVVVWLGGHAHYWPHTHEFNLQQDLAASRVIFDSGVPLIQIPCMGVTSHLHTTWPEISAHVLGQGEIGDYLASIFRDYTDDPFAWSKQIWDISTIAWLLNADWVPTELVPSPLITDEKTWAFDDSRHAIRVATQIHRDPVFRDLFTRLAGNC